MQTLLNRKTNTTAADFFTETCLLFLKSYFEQKPGYEVCSELNIAKNGNNIIRPDISIFKNKELIAALELKVSDGWKGKTMLLHLEEREKQIKQIYPDIYFGAIAFWNFFNTDDKYWGSKYIGLKTYNTEKNHPKTGAALENMINEIIQNELKYIK